jgi:serine/threonine protein kinase
VSGGELFERIIDEDFELTERECIKYMRQISEGVEYIHKQGIVHLDLKPENIMCVNKTGTRIKLIDFGLARRLGKARLPGPALLLCGGSGWVLHTACRKCSMSEPKSQTSKTSQVQIQPIPLAAVSF